MRVIALLGLCIVAVAAVPATPERIVGGSVTTINQYPTIAACLYSSDLVNYKQSCGGTILNSRSFLTAAHCTVGDAANRWRVRVGSTFANSGGDVHTLQFILNHPSYSANVTFDNDIAILRSSNYIGLSNIVQAATIAGANYNLADNQVVWAAGWGLTSSGGSPSEQLRHVQVWTVNQFTCRSRYAEVGLTVTDNMLCSGWLDVGGRDQCQGDSGGPLYHNSFVVGVSSWGRSCALPRYPGVNTRVSRFTNWIQANA